VTASPQPHPPAEAVLVQPDARSVAESPRCRPTAARNFLARGEQRRVFWLVMPPALIVMLALGWLERQWLDHRAPPAAPQIDTRMNAIHGEPPGADVVLIEPAPAPLPPAAASLGASAEALALVRDDTVFRGADEDAWFQILTTLQSPENGPPARTAAQPVGFAELFGQPVSFRGRLVRFRGTLRRLDRVPARPNPYGFTEYRQGWLEPADGPASPIVIYFLQLPEGMPEGATIAEPVEVVGYFFKRWAYAATDTVRLAPLVLALEPAWKPRPIGAHADGSIGTIALVTMTGLVLLTALGIRAAGRGRPHRVPAVPGDLTAALADADVHSTAESLRRLAAADRAAPRKSHSPVTETPP